MRFVFQTLNSRGKKSVQAQLVSVPFQAKGRKGVEVDCKHRCMRLKGVDIPHCYIICNLQYQFTFRWLPLYTIPNLLTKTQEYPRFTFSR